MIEEVDARAVLAAIPLFREALSPRQLDHLAAQSRDAIFPAGALLMAEGDFAMSMFAIVEGEVKVAIHDEHGGEHRVATLGPGEVVGEMSLLTGMRRRATVTASSDVTALEITKATIEEMFARAPELIDRIGMILTRRQAELDKIAADARARPDDILGRIRRLFGGR